MEERTKRLLKRILVGELSGKRLVKSAVFIYGSLCLFSWLGTERLLFQPHPPSYERDTTIRMLPTAGDARIASRFLESPGARYTVLFSHGNAEDLGDIAPLLEQLQGLGFSVLAYDYEGYGQSEGSPSESGAYADIDAAYAELVERRDVPPERIIAYGRSLGGGPAVDLASRRRLGGLILESTFLSVQRVVTGVTLFPGDRFQNIDKVAHVACPVLVMHGAADALIPLRHGEALFAAAPSPKRMLRVERAAHGEVPLFEGEYALALRDFAALIESSSEQAGAAAAGH